MKRVGFQFELSFGGGLRVCVGRKSELASRTERRSVLKSIQSKISGKHARGPGHQHPTIMTQLQNKQEVSQSLDSAEI